MNMNINPNRASYVAGRAGQAAGSALNSLMNNGSSQTRGSFQAQTSDTEYGLFGTYPGRPGHVVDLNGNGCYDRGTDGVTVFDFNGDGRYDGTEVHATANMMRAKSGSFDFDNNGQVSAQEYQGGQNFTQHFDRVDLNRDGRLSADEINRGRGGVWVDSNQDGQVSQGEGFSASSVPSQTGVGAWVGAAISGRPIPTHRVDSLDPYYGQAQVTTQQAHPGSGAWSQVG